MTTLAYEIDCYDRDDARGKARLRRVARRFGVRLALRDDLIFIDIDSTGRDSAITAARGILAEVRRAALFDFTAALVD